MDYAFACLLLFINVVLHIVISYDIMCQWSVHLLERLKNLPGNLATSISPDRSTCVIPKLHILGHKAQCQVRYSLNRSDGEGIERPWAHLGPVATSTREMGPGSRHDTLDDHLGHWNWKKLIGLGHLLRKRLKTAISERKRQLVAFNEFSAAQAEHVAAWELWIRDWEAKRRTNNPYILPHSGLSEKDIQLQLAQEEEAALKAGTLPLHDVSPVEFIVAGLDLEESQYVLSVILDSIDRHRLRLKRDIACKRDPTTREQAAFVQRRTRLARAIARFRQLQATYTPSAHKLVEHDDLLSANSDSPVLAENI